MKVLKETFEHEEMTPEYEFIETKQVYDSNGFLTDYTWYKDTDTGSNVFVFGDRDIYSPEDGEFDQEEENDEVAKEWFDNYEGFSDDEELEESLSEDTFVQVDLRKTADPEYRYCGNGGRSWVTKDSRYIDTWETEQEAIDNGNRTFKSGAKGFGRTWGVEKIESPNSILHEGDFEITYSDKGTSKKETVTAGNMNQAEEQVKSQNPKATVTAKKQVATNQLPDKAKVESLEPTAPNDNTEVALDIDAPPEQGAATGIANELNALIIDEWEAITGYNSALATVKDEPGHEDIVKILTDILAEENVHVGQLQAALATVAPNAESITVGTTEGKEQIEDTGSISIEDSFVPDDTFEDASVPPSMEIKNNSEEDKQ